MSSSAWVRFMWAVTGVAAVVSGAVGITLTIVAEHGSSQAAAAIEDFSAVSRYVFVPSRSQPTVTVIAQAKDQIVGTFDTGLIPTQAFVSEATAKLVASDGTAPRISIIDLKTGRLKVIDLDFVPQRLVGSADGNLVVAVDLSGGAVSVIELVRERVVSRLTGLSTIQDLMLGADGAFLYVATGGIKGIGVIDIARGVLIDEIPIGAANPGEVTGLTRSPSGRLGYAKTKHNGALSVFDMSNFRALQQVRVGSDAAKAYPTGFGGYLVIPDNVERTVTIVSSASMSVAANLKGVNGMTTALSGWFDTIALVPSSVEKKLLVYDLDRLTRANEIILPATAGSGVVTPEGTKLYLSLNDTRQVAVVDLQSRRLVKTIALETEPAGALMGRSFDICH